MSFFTGYLAQGTGGPNGFVENTASGYARQPVTFTNLANGTVSLANTSFPLPATTAVTVTQRALYDASTGGNFITWWNMGNPLSLAVGTSDLIKAGMLNHTFPALYNGVGTGTHPVDFLKGSRIGTTSEGNPVLAGHYLEVVNGTLSTASSI